MKELVEKIIGVTISDDKSDKEIVEDILGVEIEEEE